MSGLDFSKYKTRNSLFNLFAAVKITSKVYVEDDRAIRTIILQRNDGVNGMF